MLNDERRTPMKRTPFKRAAPTTKSHSNQAAALTSQALTAIKTRAPLRASTYAAPTEPAAPIAKSAPVRSEALRRAVASLPYHNQPQRFDDKRLMLSILNQRSKA